MLQQYAHDYLVTGDHDQVTLREIFSCDDRDHEHQCYLLLLVQMLADVLEAIVRDGTW